MQKVSNEYKSSMKSELRERGYIKVLFGLISQEATENAYVWNSTAYASFAYYSDNSSIFTTSKTVPPYATLEEDYMKADGSNIFLAREDTQDFVNTGLVTQKLVPDMAKGSGSTENCVRINISGGASFIGLTIDFGENYPTHFKIVASTEEGQEQIEVTDNTLSTWVWNEKAIINCSELYIYVFTMKSEYTRFRIQSILFGQGLMFDNNDVISSSLETYVSPIGADIPQTDFTVTLQNYDRYFNIDNPKSAINFLETGQTMEVWYGYATPNVAQIEWIKGATLRCSEWEADDTSATIKGQDVLRNLETEYYKGQYSANGTSFYDLAMNVLEDTEITDYYLDSELKTLTTTAPIPKTTHKEALQIIANACRCVLLQSRDGKIEIRSTHKAEFTATSNGAESYCDMKVVVDEVPVYIAQQTDYATLSTDWTSAFGNQRFREFKFPDKPYVSTYVSKEDCTFSTNPVLTLTQSTLTGYNVFTIKFGRGVPDEFEINTYDETDTLVDTITKSGDEIQTLTTIEYEFNPFVKMTITFTKTKRTYNRISVMYITFNNVTDFIMEKNDMTSSPKATKQESVKTVVVKRYDYQKAGSENTLVSENITCEKGDTFTYEFSDAVYDIGVKLGGSVINVYITGQGCFYVSFVALKAGTLTLEITGKMFSINYQLVGDIPCASESGKIITWDNPMITDYIQAKNLEEWLKEYYSQKIEYEYDTRGNPELDVGDKICQYNEFTSGMTVQVNRTVLDFSQSFSGRITARRLTDVVDNT